MIPAEYDPWLLEDENSTREIATLESFRYYALSPTTEQVVYYLAKDTTPEMRAYGPCRKTVWVELPLSMEPTYWASLHYLAHQLSARGIFKPG